MFCRADEELRVDPAGTANKTNEIKKAGEKEGKKRLKEVGSYYTQV